MVAEARVVMYYDVIYGFGISLSWTVCGGPPVDTLQQSTSFRCWGGT